MPYYEEYECGCVSQSVKLKRDLVGYCGTHGKGRRHVHKDDALAGQGDA